MANNYNNNGGTGALAPASHSQRHGFMRAFARELLVHNPTVQNIDEALRLAEEFTQKVWEDDHTNRHPKDNAKPK